MVAARKSSFAILIAFMMIVVFAPISSAANQKIKVRVQGIPEPPQP